MQTEGTAGPPRALVISAGQAVRQVLDGEGYAVRAAKNVLFGLSSLATNPVDVLVCQLPLPDTDTKGLIERVGKLPAPPPLLVVAERAVLAAEDALVDFAFDVVPIEAGADRLVRSARRAARFGVSMRVNHELTEALARETAARVRAEKELFVAREQATAGLRAKRAFLSKMSHELRTPLDAILGYAELVAEELADRDDPLAADLQRIRHSGAHLVSRLTDVLEFARKESSERDEARGQIAMAALVAQVRDATAALVAERQNELLAAVHSKETLYTDEIHLRQSLVALVEAAARATRHGTILLNVLDEDLADGRPGVRFEVVDTGGQGTALGEQAAGLPFVRRFAELAGGNLVATAVPGVGSSYTLRLPVGGP